ncbi:TnsA endonuclease N-terminal domain-containing protein [Nocardia sp. NPDC101769]|uniref:TnsA endonuclease N-terminal domain-containing protein n=1 Tax=Nocardia sp. NPDC101769 TaxID=3364333 RepID=UPI003805F5FA
MVTDGFDPDPDTNADRDDLVPTAELSPDVAAMVSRGEQIRDWLINLIESYGHKRPREAAILARRLGLRGDPPETLEQIGAHYNLSRERIRQLQQRAVTQVARKARVTADPLFSLLNDVYQSVDTDEALAQILAMEALAHGEDCPAREMTAIKLAVAGYLSDDRRRLCDLTMKQLTALRRESRQQSRSPEQRATKRISRWLDTVDWPDPAEDDHRSPERPPTTAARQIDVDDEGRGVFYLDKVDRHVAYDSESELRFLRLLDASDLVTWFREQPCAVPYELHGYPRIYYPDVVVTLADGRVILVEVKPLFDLALHINQVKFAAARRYAHYRGWGWHIWTEGSIGIAELRSRPVDPVAEQQLSQLLAQRPARWGDIVQIQEQTGLTNLDLSTLVLRHGWRLDRTPFQLRAH